MDFHLDFWTIVQLTAIGTLFFQDQIKLFLGQKGIIPASQQERIQDGLDYMKLHYNDELTAVLTEMQNDGKEHFRLLKTGQETGIEMLRTANTKLDNMDKYGVKVSR